MAISSNGSVRLSIDERSLKSFKKKVNAITRAVGDNAKKQLKDFCEKVLQTSNEMIPVDTGTAAESAGYKITREGKNNYRARMGYGIVRDPVNPRTGKRASQYIGIIHESYHYTPSKDAPVANGQGKFFEKALYMHAEDFFRKNKDSLRSILAHPNSVEDMPVDDSVDLEKLGTYLARKNEGFTARHGGEIYPFPFISEKEPPTKRKTTSKTASSVRKNSRRSFSRVDNSRSRYSVKVRKEATTKVRKKRSRKFEKGTTKKYKGKSSKITNNYREKYKKPKSQHTKHFDLLNEAVNELWNMNEENKKKKRK